MAPTLSKRCFTGIFILFMSYALMCGCNNQAQTNTAPPPSNPNVPSVQVAAFKTGDIFDEVAEKSGLKYHWEPLGKRPLTILQTIGNGCAFLDYNNDGNLDILLVGQKPALFEGDGKGQFTDVTSKTGLDQITGYFIGCAVGDYDNDGFQDVYLSGYQEGRLLHNEHGSGFKDVSATSGLKKQPWGTSCAFGDVDGDGKLDLYVCNYAVFTPDTIPQLCKFKDATGKEMMSSCGPRLYAPEKGVFYLNQGNGKFKDVTKAWNAGFAHGRGLGIGIADYDNSGKQSILIANDELPGDLLQNKGGSFHDAGVESAAAYDSESNVHGGMGADWGDYNNDGKIDLTIATFQREPKCVYRNDGGGRFTESSNALGVAQPSSPAVAFGVKWLDFDNDGYLDLLFANGHVQDNIQLIESTTSYRQKMLLLHNLGGSRFEDISAQGGPGVNFPIVGRGLAIGDYDNDGKMDALVVDSEGKPLLLHNQIQTKASWIGFQLVGAKTNRMGIGSTVIVEAGGKKLYRRCATDGSYLSASDSRVHVGLGSNDKITSVTVLWADGKKQSFPNLPLNRYSVLKEK